MNHSEPMPFVELRRAGPADAASIERLYRELVSDPSIQVLPSHVATMAESPCSFLIVGSLAGEIHGTALLTICPDAMYRLQPFGVVENVIVSENRRGCGMGRRLMNHIEEIARDHHCSKLMLLSSAHRETAHRFFKSLGYESDRKIGFVKYGSKFSRPAGDVEASSADGS